ncbi:MAG: CAP domain-containing protein [Candidatus Hydrogenedentes bacterium]|nr:CAP domain-containing protein [Candidatus Hydrogenedentota bacterium]
MGVSVRLSWLQTVACFTVTLCTGAVELGAPPLDLEQSGAFLHPAPEAKQLSVDRFDREAAANFYHDVYMSSEAVGITWSGSLATCTAGAINDAYQEATADRINYFRAMAGLPGDVQLDAALNALCLEAALMMSAAGGLSHSPPPSWACFSAGGANAAGKSNLALGNRGPSAIDAYMRDEGSNNGAVGHRRWILYPRQTVMGSGSVPDTAGGRSANALWVINGGTPSGLMQDCSWPPDGFVPRQFIFPRWSYSHPGANFLGTTVKMRINGVEQTFTPLPLSNGFGDNTIVWEPGISLAESGPDLAYTVMIENFLVGGTPMTASYEVIAFDVEGVGAVVLPACGAGERRGNSWGDWAAACGVVALLTVRGRTRWALRAEG